MVTVWAMSQSNLMAGRGRSLRMASGFRRRRGLWLSRGRSWQRLSIGMPKDFMKNSVIADLLLFLMPVALMPSGLVLAASQRWLGDRQRPRAQFVPGRRRHGQRLLSF